MLQSLTSRRFTASRPSPHLSRLAGILAVLVATSAPAFANPACTPEVQPLLAEREERGQAFQNVARGRNPVEMCQAVRRYAQAEARLVRYFEQNADWCQIPPEVVERSKEAHRQTQTLQTRICQAAQRAQEGGAVAGGTQPRGPTLGEALSARPGAGTPAVAPPSNSIDTGRGAGAFDALSTRTPR